MTTVSICIPTYEMNGRGVEYLAHNFDVLSKQTFKDFDVVVSDHSRANDIEILCREYPELTIHYFRNTEKRGNSSVNINNAIMHATGTLIKILFQDDFLYNENSLQQIVTAFDVEKDNWLVSACEHTTDGISFIRPFFPRYNNKIYLGNNTISSPSVLTIKKSTALLFSADLIWLMDVEYYKRCFDTFGAPKTLQVVTVVNRIGAHQVSNTLATKELQMKEYIAMLNRYEKGLGFWYYRVIGFIKYLFK